MYKLMYRPNKDSSWQCLGRFTDMIVAVEELDKLERGALSGSEFRIVREG